ncbi:MAG: hypothetical protein K2L94_02600, partial [Alphaproteobacteria bacterium]|nr:hypothetical protein [Alphaproteobacteria bacterium]
MKQLTEFFHTHRYVITWTMCYIAMMWAILFFLFDFHLFSGAHWHRLMHAHLRGFPGFVFGILMLAALPLYAATTTLIVRTGKPLFTITRPSWLPKWPTGKKPVTPAPAAAAEPPREKAPQKPLPADLPNELRGAFLRAREIAAGAPIPTISAPKQTDAPAQSE